jgi:hypothetical protein
MWAVAFVPALARADAPKPAAAPRKLDYDARVFVVEKAAPSLDKTVRLTPAPAPVPKNK